MPSKKGFLTVIVQGFLARDLDVRHLPSGTPVCSGSVLVEIPKKQQDDTYKSFSTYVNFKIWGKTAEQFASQCRKGSRVMFSGGLRSEPYEKNGEKLWFTYVDVDSNSICHLADPEEPQNPPPYNPHQQAPY